MNNNDDNQNFSMSGVSENLKTIISLIEGLKIEESLTLVKTLEAKWGVSAAAAVVAQGAAVGEAVAEKTEFELFLLKAGDKKIDVMKQVRTITQKDIASAKEFVEKSSEAAPGSLGVFSKETAEDYANQLKAVGASVKIQ